MQTLHESVGTDADSVGKVQFTHVDPATGKKTGWSFKISEAEAEGRG